MTDSEFRQEPGFHNGRPPGEEQSRPVLAESPRRQDFHFDLPPELIAQQPVAHRSGSRLLTLDGATGALGDQQFRELPELLRPGDLLVFNDTRVIPARLFGKKQTGGWVELFLLNFLEQAGEGMQTWECLLRSRRKIEPSAELELNLTKFFRLAVGATYRFPTQFDVGLPGNYTIDVESLKTLSYTVTLKFGKF